MTAITRGDPRSLSDVLNAFRHHRGGHSTDQRRGLRHDGRWCSTPFGITEVGIDSARRPWLRCQIVLNAFRHHRGGHRRCRRR